MKAWSGWLMGIIAVGIGVVVADVSRVGLAKSIELLPKPKVVIRPERTRAAGPPGPPPEPEFIMPGDKQPRSLAEVKAGYLKERQKAESYTQSLEEQILEAENGFDHSAWLET